MSLKKGVGVCIFVGNEIRGKSLDWDNGLIFKDIEPKLFVKFLKWMSLPVKLEKLYFCPLILEARGVKQPKTKLNWLLYF